MVMVSRRFKLCRTDLQKLLSDPNAQSGKIIEHAANMALAGRKAELPDAVIEQFKSDMEQTTNTMRALKLAGDYAVATAKNIERSERGLDVEPGRQAA